MDGKQAFGYETYLSPFTWRYGSQAMREVWSKAHQRRLWRRVWVALAAAQHRAGLVSEAQLDDLSAHETDINLERADEIEAEIHHDLMAEVRAFAEQCPVGGPVIHLGATSADIQDNADALQIDESLGLLLRRLEAVLLELADRIDERADQVCMGYTHLQPAEPTTVGYRLASYAQDLLEDRMELQRLRDSVRGKGIKGAVGTAASFDQLLEGTGMTPADMEALVMKVLDIQAFPIATQVYPRTQDFRVVSRLAGLAASLYRFAFDLRVLQSPLFGEWSEPFASKQVGSSAMPFKRNPINAENMDSLARYVAALVRVAWDNSAHSLLERTLDDSANRRLILPGAFLATDELLYRAHRVIRGLAINDETVARNVRTYGVFAATERLLMELVKAGADRQAMHELIRTHAIASWKAVQADRSSPLPDRLASDATILDYLSRDRVISLLDATAYIGDAADRARRMAAAIRKAC